MEKERIDAKGKYFSAAEQEVQQFVQEVLERNLNSVSVFQPAGQAHAEKVADLLPMCSLTFLEKFGEACKTANICYPPKMLLSDKKLSFFQKYAVWKGKGFDFPGLAFDFVSESLKDEKNFGKKLFEAHSVLFMAARRGSTANYSVEDFYRSDMHENPLWLSLSDSAAQFRSAVFKTYPNLRGSFLKTVLNPLRSDASSAAFLLTEVAGIDKSSFGDVKKELADFMLFDLEKYGQAKPEQILEIQRKNAFLTKLEGKLYQNESMLAPLFLMLKTQEGIRLAHQKEMLKKQADEEIRRHQEKIRLVRSAAQHQLDFLTQNQCLKLCAEHF